MLYELIKYRKTLWLLATRNIEDRYTGTAGGLLWAVLNPLLLLLVYWVVFDIGLRMNSGSGEPFVLVLFCGLIPWMAFSEAITGAASSITGRAYLVKKIAFPLEVLPATHLLAALLTHAILLVILYAMLLAYGRNLGLPALLLPYYIVCMIALAAGFSYLLAAASVFYRDVNQGLNVILNVWFWVTPIVWPPDLVAGRLKPLLFYNPLNYVVTGYREAVLGSGPGSSLTATLYFWVCVVVIWLAGTFVFARLKPAFADVL